MRRKRSQSPLTPGGASSPHRTTRASSRSPRIIVTPAGGSTNSPKNGTKGPSISPPRRHASASPKKLSPDVGGISEINSCYRRSTRAKGGLNRQEEKELMEEKSDVDNNSENEVKSRRLRADAGKRANYNSKPPDSKRARTDKNIKNDASHSFVTSDEVKVLLIASG